MIRKQFTISGKVQGVWFRGGTREQALELGLSGYARNLADGRVEVQAQGNGDAIDRLERWLQRGPPLAKVSQILTSVIEPVSTDFGFRII